LDRFYGFYDSEQFLKKLNEILDGRYTFPNLLKQYEAGNKSAETISMLAKKYADRGEDSTAISLYQILLESKNVSYEMYHEAKYFISVQLLWSKGFEPLQIYLTKNPESPFLKDGINQLLAFFKNTNEKKELECYNRYLSIFDDDPTFLNQYAWRMTELNQSLENAFEKVNKALKLLDATEQGYANIIDTKAEILWKIGDYKEAVIIINEALEIEPENEYYQMQKAKFIEASK